MNSLYEYVTQNKKAIFAVAVVLALFIAGNYYINVGYRNVNTLGAQLLPQSNGVFISSSQSKCEQKGGVFAIITLSNGNSSTSCSLPSGKFQPVPAYSPVAFSCETIAKGIYGTWYSPGLNSPPVLVCMLKKPVSMQLKTLKSCKAALGYYTSSKKCYFGAP
ncbi:MAG: hypothetical protein Q8R36_02585 [bacterium]|nr:hypothetical protein [bacterium]